MTDTQPSFARFNAHHPVRVGQSTHNNVTIHYQDEGYINDPVMILVSGLGCQLTMWPQEIVNGLVNEGYRVIRLDNRDMGLSDQVSQGVNANLPAAMVRFQLRFNVPTNYTLYDMCNDIVGLMDNLSIKKAHITGVSMGGMISQIFAALFPHRALSLTSIMSTTNEPHLPFPRLDIMLFMAGIGVPKGHEKERAVDRGILFWRKVGSPKYPTNEDELRTRLGADYDRAYRPAGYLRQSQAILATGGFSSLLTRIQCPTQIIHGDKDPLISKKCGIASNKAIRHSKIELIRGMGHDLPPQLYNKLLELIAYNALCGDKRR